MLFWHLTAWCSSPGKIWSALAWWRMPWPSLRSRYLTRSFSQSCKSCRWWSSFCPKGRFHRPVLHENAGIIVIQANGNTELFTDSLTGAAIGDTVEWATTLCGISWLPALRLLDPQGHSYSMLWCALHEFDKFWHIVILSSLRLFGIYSSWIVCVFEMWQCRAAHWETQCLGRDMLCAGGRDRITNLLVWPHSPPRVEAVQGLDAWAGGRRESAGGALEGSP